MRKSYAGLMRESYARVKMLRKCYIWALDCRVLCGGLVPPRPSGKSASLMPPRPCIRLLHAKSLMRPYAPGGFTARSLMRALRVFFDIFCFQFNTVYIYIYMYIYVS